MSVSFEDVIKNFMDGMNEGTEGAESTTGTLKIKVNQLVHYWTPIAERYEGAVIVNITRYSLATGKLQKQLKDLVPKDKYIPVKGVREGYKSSLSDFLPQEAKC